LSYIDSFCKTWSELDGHYPIDMDLYYFVPTTCSFAQLFGLPIFLKYHLLGSIIVALLFWFSLMRFSWIRCSLLCVIACQSAINGILRNMSLLKTRLPGLLPEVECTPAHRACIAIDNASSTYCSALAIFLGGYHVIVFLEHFLLFGAFFHIQY
jgi:hypothetical protein